jgi:uncharacterized protein with FMN-binding domain
VGDKKVANSVVALSSAAVLAIYGAGYARTRAAADRFAQQAAERRPHIPATRETPALQIDAPAPTTVARAEEAEAAEDHGSGAKTRSDAELTPQAPRVAPRLTANNEVARPVAKAEPKPEHAAAPSVPEPVTGSDGEASVETAQATTPPVAPPAPAPVAPAPPAEPAKAGYKDGTFYGWGTSRHGDIQAAVVIEDGKITVARVERCLTRYSCSWITPIPPRILIKQGTTYDYVSGATESSDAFQDAVAEALSQAK